MDIISAALAPTFTVRSAVAAAAGGLVLGCVAVTKLHVNGNILGISGIVGGLTKKNLSIQDMVERAAFLVGMVSAGGVLAHVAPQTLGQSLFIPTMKDAARLGVAGFFVGIGTARGNGCTSGHGIMGNSRFSVRSAVATVSFMSFGFAAATMAKTSSWLPSLLQETPSAAATALSWPLDVPASVSFAASIAIAFGAAVLTTVTVLPALFPEPKVSKSASSAPPIQPAHRLVRPLVDGLAGLSFGVALGLAGMVDPKNVASFLDVSGGLSTWDPTLAFVMAGAIGLAAPTLAKTLRQSPSVDSTSKKKKKNKSPSADPVCDTGYPMTCNSYSLPPSTAKPDFKLASGAAIFGVGWGISGFCPGPALIGLGGTIASSGLAAAGPFLAFNSGMFAGWATHHRGLS